ncbi:MAG: UDP-N-acetylglucosamine 1-carboxyvinyltransferase [Planctomycetota bacterium]|jgi:UDP-N-acetylglucosamine 1-carboxyvinyltransferase
MDTFHITGGKKLRGSIKASGNKNAALPLLALSILLDGELKLNNLPLIGDVLSMISMLEEIGVKCENPGDGTLKINTDNIKNYELNSSLSHKLRGSVLLAAPLLSRFKSVYLPFPGGDKIGRRRLDTHIHAFRELGADIEIKDSGYSITCKNGLKGADILLDEASVTATENAVMAASLAEGQTIIRNAAGEPHVQEVCNALNTAGANISGIGTNQLTIEGVKNLKGIEFDIGADHIEVGSLISLAAVTDSEITITDASPEYLRMILLQFKRLGIEVEIKGNDVFVPAGQKLVIDEDIRGAIPKIEDAPWPGFPADMTSIAVITACFAKGSVMVFEKLFESRMFFVDQLIDMGAKIVLCDPHRAVIIGPNKLRGRSIISPDIRAGMALLIASLAAEGKSIIRSVDQIDRGYEKIDSRLQGLGAEIERISE